ncbi:HEAT repeat domain-containing protein [Nocardioides sp. GXQ0305]|uniref:HEAT repeat domain-containing protein n=1 Tax=Nocardioides sp. GXQ0305 TaxID=3423912 RepID=UPI003D7CA0B0
MGGRPVGELIEELAERLGRERFAEVCVALLLGASREDHLDHLPWLTGHDWSPGEPVRDPAVWKDYWVRTWGARGLLHVWDDSATAAVVAGLDDDEWRPAEMCLKVVARHEVVGAGDGAAALLDHDLPRVRVAALRALAVVGDTEHADAVRAAQDDPDADVRRHAGRAWVAMRERLDLREEA